MKRLLLSLSIAVLLNLGLSACSPKPTVQFTPASAVPKTEYVIQADGVAKLSAAPTTHADTTAESDVTPADALKLILLQWLVAR
jgi:hypothetical protein